MDSPSFAKDKRRIHFTCLWTGFHQRRAADADIRGVRANGVESIDGYTSGGKISIESVKFSSCCDHFIIYLFIFMCWHKIGNFMWLGVFSKKNLNKFKAVTHTSICSTCKNFTVWTSTFMAVSTLFFFQLFIWNKVLK